MNKKLKARIIDKFGTQADFAQAMRVDESIISRVLHGRKTLKPKTKEMWARVLECSLNILSSHD